MAVVIAILKILVRVLVTSIVVVCSYSFSFSVCFSLRYLPTVSTKTNSSGLVFSSSVRFRPLHRSYDLNYYFQGWRN